jgi:hypothetical protein
MNDNSYNVLAGQHRAFMVYNNQYYPNNAMIKIYMLPGDEPTEKLVVDKLYQLQKEKYWPIEHQIYFVVRGRVTRHPLTKMKVMEYAAEVNIAADVALEWLKDNTNDIPLEAETIEFGKEGWSVGPCIFKKLTESKWGTRKGTYVKVRFNKMSIPFYLDETRKIWQKDQTHAGLMVENSTRIASASIMTFLEKNETEILSRVAERPFNKSGIGEYDPPHVSFFNKVGTNFKLMFHQGASNKVDQSKLADPAYKPVVTLLYSKTYGDNNWRDIIVAVIDDKMYEVTKYDSDNSWHSWTDKNTSFKEKDLKDIDPADEYVRERAERALRAKL